MRPKFIIHHLAFIIALSLALVCESADAQWKKIATFPETIATIYFLDLPGPPRIGFVGTTWAPWPVGKSNPPAVLYKTTNGGATWFESGRFDSNVHLSGISFKDSLTGWIICKWRITNGVGRGTTFRTKDGGATWQELLDNTGQPIDKCAAVYYYPPTKRLFVSRWSKPFTWSSDEGDTWNDIQNFNLSNGTAFLNDMDGFASGYENGKGLICATTSDGGSSWNISPSPIECWQPLAIKGTHTAFSVHDQGNEIYRTNDAGLTWQKISMLASEDSLTGMIGGDLQTLLVQTTKDIFISKDEGLTWQSTNGPGNFVDTRFFIDKCFAYAAADTDLWLNLFPSGDTPTLDAEPMTIKSEYCARKDTIVKFSIKGDCLGFVTLDSISVSGSSYFQLEAGLKFPITIKGSDSLKLYYYPQRASKDTSLLHLHFSSGGVKYDTTISILGVTTDLPRTSRIALSLIKNTIEPRGSAVAAITALDNIPQNSGLDSITTSIAFDDDVLAVAGLSDGAWQTEILNNPKGNVTLRLKRKSANAVLAGTTLGSVNFKGYIAKTNYSPLQLGPVISNDGTVADCALSALSTNDSLTIHIADECGSETLRSHLRGETLKLSIRPNPTGGEIQLGITNYELGMGDASLSVVDALGKEVFSTHTLNPIPYILPTTGWASGIYFVRVKTERGVVSGSFVKE